MEELSCLSSDNGGFEAWWTALSPRQHSGRRHFSLVQAASCIREGFFGQFQARLKDHRLAAAKDVHRAMQEEQCFEHDRSLHPRHEHNEKGELVFDMHPAKLLLRQDVENKLHLLTAHNTPRKLQASRPEHLLFKPQKFGECIWQEIKVQKYLHCLKLKREAVRNGKKKVQSLNLKQVPPLFEPK
jgi:hypothetical protein